MVQKVVQVSQYETRSSLQQVENPGRDLVKVEHDQQDQDEVDHPQRNDQGPGNADQPSRRSVRDSLLVARASLLESGAEWAWVGQGEPRMTRGVAPV